MLCSWFGQGVVDKDQLESLLLAVLPRENKQHRSDRILRVRVRDTHGFAVAKRATTTAGQSAFVHYKYHEHLKEFPYLDGKLPVVIKVARAAGFYR